MAYKKVYLKPGKEESLKRFHPWVFSGAIQRIEGEPEEGEIVDVYTSKKEFIACGHFQIGSIAVRVLSFKEGEIDHEFWKHKLEVAYDLRRSLGLAGNPANNTYRLVHGEGDNLPGLIIDVYDHTAVMQAHSAGMHVYRMEIADALSEVMGDVVRNIYYKSETTLPFKADLGPENGFIKGGSPENIAMEYGLKFHVDWLKGQKTGFFVDQRGTRPYYFDAEHPEAVKKGHEDELRYQYNQAHLPVREQDEAVGHAVRAVYLYSGMADIARLTGDEALYAACEKLWDNITRKKMYITGGIGATHMGEAFSFNYDLPNDTAYAETCASIGLVFFARRMLEIKADRKYADVMERALYNGILSGMALDGKSFFYVNPLESLPEACHKDERKFHVKPVRQKWFGCACCPPNIARLLSSIASYAYTEAEDSLYVHLYMGSVLEKDCGGKKLDLRITSDFPWDGKVTAEVNA